jgi:CBS domain-containing protein
MGRLLTAREIMRRDFVHADPDESLLSVRQTMRLGRIRHLLVARHELLQGLLSYRDLIEALSGPEAAALRRARVADVMQQSPVTIVPESSLLEIAGQMCRYGFGCLPVVDVEGRLVGLVTESDLLRAAYGLPATH